MKTILSLDALRGRWIRMGLAEEDVDKIINKWNGWKE